MAIRLATSQGTVDYNPSTRVWAGPQPLLDVIDRFPEIPVKVNPVAVPVDVDHDNEIWVYLHAAWAFQDADIDVEVVDAPRIDGYELPSGTVA